MTDSKLEANLIVCMAGFNTRFHDMGFDIPKYLLPWQGSTIINSILMNLGDFRTVVLVGNERDRYFYPKLKESLSGSSADINTIYISDTRGQAETAYVGLSQIVDEDIPLFIHNSDTIVANRDIHSVICSLNNSPDSAYIDTFIGSNPAYSYVSVERDVAIEIKEKHIISPYASSGLYGFSSSKLFTKYFNQLEVINQSSAFPELYISNLIQLMIDDNLRVYVNPYTDNSKTTVLGTPQEYGLEIAKNALMSEV